ncbi:FAD-dependent oxidoreductase [Streptantibioticus silvisoli]|uniref:FAD-dependent oxidoreductase n=1 Tax=Streptantibioticus silvisoli TaxID=2705255 RepID=A0ABT6W784_9ACTN|nr:FAD-dependent oxidoreductase [Streptantibioticus silvisoli]MDI5966599.1 FAD-dependent oxidoreductase [Streptantibioticus silvisoli]
MKPVVVIGAGPYGLSTAAHLTGLGVPVRVFGVPMAGWSEAMPAGTILCSPPADSSIAAPEPGHTLQDFNDAMGERRLLGPRDLVTLDTFVRYGRWYADRLVPAVEGVRVADVTPLADRRDVAGFRLRLESGEEFTAPAVVVATGLTGAAHLPHELRGLAPAGPSPGGPVSHSSQHTVFHRFAGRHVAVVGAGQSALESAALLTDAGATVTLLARRPGSAGFGPPPPHRGPPRPGPALLHRLPAALRRALDRPPPGPRGAWWLRDRFTGAVTVLDGHRVAAAGRTTGDHAAAEGVRTEGVRTEGVRTEGVRTEGVRTEGVRTEGVRTEGVRAGDLPAGDARTEGARTGDLPAGDVRTGGAAVGTPVGSVAIGTPVDSSAVVSAVSGAVPGAVPGAVSGAVPGAVSGGAVARGGGLATGSRVLLLTGGPAGPGELVADHVLAATGYRFDLDALDFLAVALRARLTRDGGAPRLDQWFRSSLPGLFFAGPVAASAFGGALRTVRGTGFAAPRVARAIAAAVGPGR